MVYRVHWIPFRIELKKKITLTNLMASLEDLLKIQSHIKYCQIFAVQRLRNLKMPFIRKINHLPTFNPKVVFGAYPKNEFVGEVGDASV